jgi:hypothetical protein
MVRTCGVRVHVRRKARLMIPPRNRRTSTVGREYGAPGEIRISSPLSRRLRFENLNALASVAYGWNHFEILSLSWAIWATGG